MRRRGGDAAFEGRAGTNRPAYFFFGLGLGAGFGGVED